MTRRALLAALCGAAADPERLLWTPGKRLISIPRVVMGPWEEVRFDPYQFAYPLVQWRTAIEARLDEWQAAGHEVLASPSDTRLFQVYNSAGAPMCSVAAFIRRRI